MYPAETQVFHGFSAQKIQPRKDDFLRPIFLRPFTPIWSDEAVCFSISVHIQPINDGRAICGMLILLTILGGKQRYEKATQMEAL